MAVYRWVEGRFVPHCIYFVRSRNRNFCSKRFSRNRSSPLCIRTLQRSSLFSKTIELGALYALFLVKTVSLWASLIEHSSTCTEYSFHSFVQSWPRLNDKYPHKPSKSYVGGGPHGLVFQSLAPQLQPRANPAYFHRLFFTQPPSAGLPYHSEVRMIRISNKNSPVNGTYFILLYLKQTFQRP